MLIFYCTNPQNRLFMKKLICGFVLSTKVKGIKIKWNFMA